MLKAILLTLALFAAPVFTQAQFGINGSYRTATAPDWDLVNTNNGERTELLGAGFAVGIDYWFRLPNYRVELLPELNAFRSTAQIPGSIELTNSLYSLFLNTNIYILDFRGDCECPTFSKSGATFEKGFFLQVSPGISLPVFEDTMPNLPDKSTVTGSPTISIGLGVGIDLGVSDLLTITPLVGFRYYPSLTWKGRFPAIEGDELDNFILESEESHLNQFYGGIRFGFRFDD